MVAEGEDHIAHQLDALIPLAAEILPFLIAGGLCGHDTVAVIGADIRRTSGNVHKADVVGAAFTDQQRVQIMHPFRDDACGGPFVGRALRIAAQPHGAVVDQQALIPVIGHFAEAGRDGFTVQLCAARKQADLHPV